MHTGPFCHIVFTICIPCPWHCCAVTSGQDMPPPLRVRVATRPSSSCLVVMERDGRGEWREKRGQRDTGTDPQGYFVSSGKKTRHVKDQWQGIWRWCIMWTESENEDAHGRNKKICSGRSCNWEFQWHMMFFLFLEFYFLVTGLKQKQSAVLQCLK